MKVTKFTIGALLAAGLLTVGCSSWSNKGRGAAYGGGGGALLGAGIGAIAGGGKGALIGSAIGAGVGAGAGVLVGNRMDKQKRELERELANNAKVETVKDRNGLDAIQITFSEGILFQTGSSTLSTSARNSLIKFAESLKNNPDTDVTILGNTDNTGSRQVNERLSRERAQAVENFLMGQGIRSVRFIDVRGLAYDNPVANNDTADGRAANRRVDIFLTANQEMVQKAEAGNL